MTVTGFQQKALTKGYHDDESTSREEKISTNKLSVLPSLPENLKVTGSTILCKYFHRAPSYVVQEEC